MQALKKLLCGIKNNNKTSFAEITNAMIPLIEKTSQEIFRDHSDKLIREDALFVAEAVWGIADGVHCLTEEQSEINNRISLVLEKIISLWKLNESDIAQIHAVDYLVRTIIMTKIHFMTEMLRGKMYVMRSPSDGDVIKLLHLEPIGRA